MAVWSVASGSCGSVTMAPGALRERPPAWTRASGTEPGLQGAAAACDLEQRVSVLLRIDRVATAQADLTLPVPVDVLVRPSAGDRALVAADHLRPGPHGVGRDEEPAPVAVDREPERADQSPGIVVEVPRHEEEPDGSFRERLGGRDRLPERRQW